jgi:hypothetical protein
VLEPPARETFSHKPIICSNIRGAKHVIPACFLTQSQEILVKIRAGYDIAFEVPMRSPWC